VIDRLGDLLWQADRRTLGISTTIERDRRDDPDGVLIAQLAEQLRERTGR